MIVHITPETHIVRETEAGRMFRRLLNFPDIFTYFNSETGQWVLAYWVNHTARQCHEIEDLGAAMELVNPGFVRQIVNCWKPVDWGKKKKMILSRERTRIRKGKEDACEDQERWAWAKKRVANKAPIPYAFHAKMTGGDVL